MGFFGNKTKKFGQIALEKGYITKKDLEEALAEQRKFKEKGILHKKIGSILLEKGSLEVDEINMTLMQQKQNPFWSYVVSFLSLRRGT